MQINHAASGPGSDTAGAASTDPLEAAFSAAAESVLGGHKFVESVGDKPAAITEQPGDDTAGEGTGEPDSPNAEQTAKDDGKARRQPRDPKGRWAPGEQEAAAAEAAAPNAAPSEGVLAPAHWDPQTREAFAKLPTPEAQKAMVDMAKRFEATVTRKTQELAEDRRFAESVRAIIDDNDRAQLRQAGMSEAQGIQRLVELNRYATQDPAGYVRWLVQSARLDPSQLFPELSTGAPRQPGQAPAQPSADPNFNRIMQALDQVNSRVESYERQQQEAAAREQQAQLAQAEATIQRFATAVDDAGQPLHPFFDRVRDTMLDLLATPRLQRIGDYGDRLAKAYQMAVAEDPDLYSGAINTEVQRKEAERRKREEVEKAKRARPAVSDAPTVAPVSAPKGLDAALKQAGGIVGAW